MRHRDRDKSHEFRKKNPPQASGMTVHSKVTQVKQFHQVQTGNECPKPWPAAPPACQEWHFDALTTCQGQLWHKCSIASAHWRIRISHRKVNSLSSQKTQRKSSCHQRAVPDTLGSTFTTWLMPLAPWGFMEHTPQQRLCKLCLNWSPGWSRIHYFQGSAYPHCNFSQLL